MIANKTLLEQRLDMYFKHITKYPNTWISIGAYPGRNRPVHKIIKEQEYLISRLMTGLALIGLNPQRQGSKIMIMSQGRKSTNDF